MIRHLKFSRILWVAFRNHGKTIPAFHIISKVCRKKKLSIGKVTSLGKSRWESIQTMETLRLKARKRMNRVLDSKTRRSPKVLNSSPVVLGHYLTKITQEILAQTPFKASAKHSKSTESPSKIELKSSVGLVRRTKWWKALRYPSRAIHLHNSVKLQQASPVIKATNRDNLKSITRIKWSLS